MRNPKLPLLKKLVRNLQKARISKSRPTISLVEIKKEIDKFRSDRRKFIIQSSKTIAAISIGTILPLSSCKSDKENNLKHSQLTDSNKIKVAIIGAGIAGLNCAYHLKKSGIDATIFEASTRVGGRIHTHYNDSLQNGVHPEFGGDFIDSNHEDMLNLCSEFNLDLIDLKDEQKKKGLIENVFYFENRKISDKEIIKEFKKISAKLDADISSLGENYDTDSAIRLDNLPLEEYIDSLRCAKWLKDILKAAYIAEYGLDCSEQSTLNFLDMINLDVSDGFEIFGDSDERYRIVGGNSKIIEALKTEINSESLKLGHELISLSKTIDQNYILKFKNNTEYIADKVVIAIPFTILRNIEMNIEDLSEEKMNCIQTLGYGKNTKLALSYGGQPWQSKRNNSMGYLFHKDIVNGWDGSYNKEEGNKNGVYMCYFGGKFSEDLDKISSKNTTAPPTHVWKTQLPDDKVQGFVNELEAVFPDSKTNFQGKHVFVNWIDYPYTKGSYSCYKVGQWSTIAGLESEPVGNVYFAGEHCSENFQGYMNGAAESGRHVAEKFINTLQISK